MDVNQIVSMAVLVVLETVCPVVLVVLDVVHSVLMDVSIHVHRLVQLHVFHHVLVNYLVILNKQYRKTF